MMILVFLKLYFNSFYSNRKLRKHAKNTYRVSSLLVFSKKLTPMDESQNGDSFIGVFGVGQGSYKTQLGRRNGGRLEIIGGVI